MGDKQLTTYPLLGTVSPEHGPINSVIQLHSDVSMREISWNRIFFISINLIYFATFNNFLVITKFDKISKRVQCKTDSLDLIVKIFNNQVLFFFYGFVVFLERICVTAGGLDIYMTVVYHNHSLISCLRTTCTFNSISSQMLMISTLI